MVSRVNSRMLPVLVVALAAGAVGCFGGKGEPIRNGEDLLIAGGSPHVRLLDSIPGDAILTGGEINFEGTTGGDYLGAGGRQTIRGQVSGSLRAVGGEIQVGGVVGRNATVGGGNVSLDSGAVIGGNAYMTGGTVSIAGGVRGSLFASGGEVTINGPVGRDVEIAAGGLHLGSRAQITGNLRYRVPKDKVRIDAGARVGGTTTAIAVKTGLGARGALWLVGLLIAGVVLVALFPAFTTEAAETLYRRPGRSGLVGLGWTILLPVAAVIAAVTIIGLPLALLGVAAWLIVVFLGDLPVALWLGKKILGQRAKPGRSGAIFSVLVGGLVLVVLALVPVLGTLVLFAAAIFGAGAILIRMNAARMREPNYSV